MGKGTKHKGHKENDGDDYDEGVGLQCCSLRCCLFCPIAIIVLLLSPFAVDLFTSRLRSPTDVDIVQGPTQVVVTGSTTGIGHEAAKQFCSLGAHVIVHGSSPKRTQKAAEDVQKAGSGIATPVHGDLSNFTDVRAIAERIATAMKHVDILILNAAMMYGPDPSGPSYKKRVFDRPASDFIAPGGQDFALAVNHYGQYLLVRLLVPMLSKHANVVFLTGVGNWDGKLNRVLTEIRPRWDLLQYRYFAYMAYFDSKLANVCTARALARRLGDKAQAFILDPGLVATAISLDRNSTYFTAEHYKNRKFTTIRHWTAPAEAGGRAIVQSGFIKASIARQLDYVAPLWLPRPWMAFLVKLRSLGYDHIRSRMGGGHHFPQVYQKLTYGSLYQTYGPPCSEMAQEQLWAISAHQVGLPP